MKWMMIFLMAMTSACFAQFDLLKSAVESATGSSSTPVDVDKMVESTQKIAKGATGIGLKEELEIGGSVAVEIVSHYGGIWKNEEATKRVNLIGKTVANFSDRPDLNYRFGILDTDNVNAFSAPGGYVFITRGAYQAAANDDQLAGVLAHEVTHIAHRHALRIISRNELISGLADAASGASGDFAAYDLGVDKISNTLFKFGFDPDTEYEADRIGKRTASVAGYNPDGLHDFLQGLLNLKGENGKPFSTHPDLQDRIDRLSGKVDEEERHSSNSSSGSSKLKMRGDR
jgi:predicted Zn-dependent protease